jgi:hypothetical protein
MLNPMPLILLYSFIIFPVHPCCLFNLPVSFLLFIIQIKFSCDREVFYLIYVMTLSVAMVRWLGWSRNEWMWSNGGKILAEEDCNQRAETCPHCHFVRHKVYMAWTRNQPWPQRLKGLETGTTYILTVYFFRNFIYPYIYIYIYIYIYLCLCVCVCVCKIQYS